MADDVAQPPVSPERPAGTGLWHPQDDDSLRRPASVTPVAGDEDPQVTQHQPVPPTESGLPRVPGFELLELLGRGGMGVVYKARQVALNRVVALKMVLAGEHAGPEERARFLAEAEAVAALQHPGIVQVYEFGTHAGLPYFALEYCPGGSLDDKINGTPLPASQSAGVAEQLARAVQAAHEQDIVHRDLKPGNVLLAADGTPKITDFGLAKRVHSHSDLTQTGTILGTPSYMAPEQAAGDVKHVGPAADIYALGAILYECLTGRPPFKAATTLDTVLQVKTAEPASVRRLNPHAPADLETICHKCLQKDPVRRYPKAAALADDLARWTRGEPITARPISRIGRGWRWCRRHPLAAGVTVTAVALLLVLIAGVLRVARSRHDELLALALRKNAADARHVASTVLLRLQAIAAFVEEAAEEPELRRLVRGRGAAGLRDYCRALADRRELHASLGPADPLASWMVLDGAGNLLAVSHGEGVRNPHLPGRDYVQGALAAARTGGRPSVHVSRVYLSENQHLYKFGLSVAVRDPDGGPSIGIIAVTLATTATLGPRLVEGDQEVVLAAPEDTNPPHDPPPPVSPPAEYLIVVHPAYHLQQEPLKLPGGLLPTVPREPGPELQLPREERGAPPAADYHDPAAAIDSRFAGDRLAGFAFVGNTEFAVIVQQSYDAVMASDRELMRELAAWGAVTLALGALTTVGLVGGRAWAVRRRTRTAAAARA
jgi:serine/threonine-protein kinase